MESNKKRAVDQDIFCIVKHAGDTYNDSQGVREVYTFLEDPENFDKIAAYISMSLDEKTRALKRFSTVGVSCHTTPRKSFYHPSENKVHLNFLAWTRDLRPHVYLHEFMHCIVDCAHSQKLGARWQWQWHCLEFKKALLYSDFLYGLLSKENFLKLEPLVGRDLNHAYKFERSYEPMLTQTTRHTYDEVITRKEVKVKKLTRHELEKSREIEESNDDYESILHRITKLIDIKDRVRFQACRPRLRLMLEVNDPNNASNEIKEKLNDSILKDFFHDDFFRKIDEKFKKIPFLQTEQVNAHCFVIQLDHSTLNQSRYDTLNKLEWEAYFFKLFLGSPVPKIDKRHIFEAEFKYMNKEYDFFHFDFPERRDCESLDYYSEERRDTMISGKKLKEYMAQKILQKECFEIEVVHHYLERGADVFDNCDLSFDGYFLSKRRSHGSNVNCCFADDIKTDNFYIDINSFTDVYNYDIADIREIVELFTEKVVAKDIFDYRCVHIFDIDTVFTNILSIVRNDSEIQHWEKDVKFSSISQFLSAQEYKNWQQEVPFASVRIVSDLEDTYYNRNERFELIKEQFLSEDVKRIRASTLNLIGGCRQALLSQDEFDPTHIAAYIQKGIPFIFAYADSETATQEQMFFIYFDGRYLAVFNGYQLTTKDEINLDEVLIGMRNSTIAHIDFGNGMLPRPNYSKTQIAVDVQALLESPVATFGDNLIVNLFAVPKHIYVNDIIQELEVRPNLLLKAVIDDSNQMIAVFHKKEFHFVYVNKIGQASIVDAVYAWWLLAL